PPTLPSFPTRRSSDLLRDTIGAPMPPIKRAGYEAATAAVRIHLGEKAFAAAWTQGRMMTPEQALLARDHETTCQQSPAGAVAARSEEHTSELQSRGHL